MDLNKIYWSFSKVFYSDIEKFEKDVIEHNENIDLSNWNAQKLAFNVSELQIEYMAWITGPEDLLENESLIEEDQKVFEEEPDATEYQVEILSKLKADNGSYFTAIEFLWKSHNQQSNKRLGDHVFFEGTDTTPIIKGGLPTYFIACGS